MRSTTSSLGVLLALLSITGCPGPNRPASAFPTADDALGRMHATYSCANGIQGDSKIDHRNPQGRIRGDLYLFAINPDLVRFDVVSPFGATLYTLTSDGKTFQMLDVKEKTFMNGPAKACNLARLTQVPVPGHALVSLLRGEAPVLVHQPKEAAISWDEKGFYKLLIQSTRNASEEIHIEVRPDDVNKPWGEQRVRVTEVLVTQAGVDLYHVELKNHAAAETAKPRTDPDGLEAPVPPSGGACDAEVPKSIRMRVPNTEEDVIFQYKDAHWNPPLLKDAFAQPVPGGVHRIYQDCKD